MLNVYASWFVLKLISRSLFKNFINLSHPFPSPYNFKNLINFLFFIYYIISLWRGNFPLYIIWKILPNKSIIFSFKSGNFLLVEHTTDFV
jgi:hypothetical protein